MRRRGIENNKISEAINRKTISELLKEQSVSIIADIIEECVPAVGKAVGNLLRKAIIPQDDDR